jgi:hypothetical protein
MTQYSDVKAHLLEGKAITPLESLRDYGCFRLAAIICKLREEGYLITTTMVDIPGREGKDAFASYTLVGFDSMDKEE